MYSASGSCMAQPATFMPAGQALLCISVTDEADFGLPVPADVPINLLHGKMPSPCCWQQHDSTLLTAMACNAATSLCNVALNTDGAPLHPCLHPAWVAAGG